MLYAVAGALAFVLLCVVDLLYLRGFQVGKALVFCAASLLFLAGIIGSVGFSPRFPTPPALRVLGWALGAAALTLAVVALVVEVPTFTLYLTAGRDRRLVTTGMYAVTRHPGVLWFSLLLLSLVLITGSRVLAAATPLWIALDVGHVAWQERQYLVKVYGEEYRRYQAEVPMLLPTASSIRRGVESRRSKKEET